MVLPPDLVADDVIGLRDQMSARIAAVLRPRGGKRKEKENDTTLPRGVEPLAALPPHIDRPWKRLDAAATELQGFRGLRASAQADQRQAAPSEPARSAANTDSDDRWRAFEQWNAGAAGLSDDGETLSPSEARWLYAQLFPVPEGLRFITRRPQVQWAAMVQRMKTLEEERAQAVIEGFGGTRHYQQLVAAHARFGEAYGFTKRGPRQGGRADRWPAAVERRPRSAAEPDPEDREPHRPGDPGERGAGRVPAGAVRRDGRRPGEVPSEGPVKKPEAVPAAPVGVGGTR
ncbi:hypothetical protein WME94_19885 [Sorangium sp. So ce429]